MPCDPCCAKCTHPASAPTRPFLTPHPSRVPAVLPVANQVRAKSEQHLLAAPDMQRRAHATVSSGACTAAQRTHRVALERKLLVGLADVFDRGVARDAERGIQISLGLHFEHSPGVQGKGSLVGSAIGSSA